MPSERGKWDPLLVVAVTLCAAAISLVFNHRFYFYDDTQSYSIGTWYGFGQRLREDDLSFLQLHTWTSGNVLVEGQWGVFNPIMIAISLGATVVGNLGLYATVLKFGFLVLAALGYHRVALLLDAGRRNALIVGCAVPLAGFTVYMDAASWINGLIVWALFSWVWVALLRFRSGHWGYLPLAGTAFLVISVGYPYAAVAVLGLFVSYALAEALHSRWRPAARYVLMSLVVLAMMLLVFLPAALTAAATTRDQRGITSTGFWGPDLSDLATLTAIVPGVQIPNYGTDRLSVPLFYIAWIVPLLLVGLVGRLRDRRFDWATAVFAVGVLLFMLGPTEMGPLRNPVRVLPYFAAALLVLAVQGSRDEQWSLIRGRSTLVNAAWFVPLPLLGAWLTFSDTPARLPSQVVGLVIVLLGLLAVVRLAGGRWLIPGFVAVTLIVTLVSRFYAPRAQLAEFGIPAATARLQTQLPGVTGQTFVVGDLRGAPLPQIWEETLLARTWEVNPAQVQNSYTVIAFNEYVETFGMNHLGLTGAEALPALFAGEPVTGAPLADLMSLQNVQLLKNTVRPGAPPAGWEVSQDGRFTQVWSRVGRAPRVGGVSHTSEGVTVTTVTESPDRISMLVTNTSSEPGLVVLSRLAWPGYRVSGAAQAPSPNGFLLAVEVPPGAAQTPVEVAFEPPGLRMGVAAVLLALLLVVGLEVRRRRSIRSSA